MAFALLKSLLGCEIGLAVGVICSGVLMPCCVVVCDVGVVPQVKLSFDFTGRKVAVTDSTEQVRAGQAFGKQIGKKFAEADDDVPVKPTATTSGLKPSPLPPPKPLPNKPTSSTKPSTMTAATQKLIAEGLYLGAGAGAGPFTNTVCGSDHNNDAFLPNNTLTGR